MSVEEAVVQAIPTSGSGSATAAKHDNKLYSHLWNASEASLASSTDPEKTSQDGEEKALESHEVIELQTFSERKAWIEEKIQFLEKMPPIEVFAGLDAVRSSSEQVSGLPGRDELQQWITEHDKIEKETEIFDSGELKKLKKFTKAATQRNLSPEDTDLIELTLTTIYELDKLLHLLRDRSEHLDLLNTRLAWEEHRTTAWVDRRKVITDLQGFLASRARWSPSVYDVAPKGDGILTRRGSVASMASDASSSSSPGFSRSARFKLAELLSRDAAQFGSRVSSLRHSKISAAGKALDKLIDNSRKPVPEELLDEQDRLEEKGITELENIGKFVMNMVMQWRKADEIYVETMKDQATAQNLLEEIETARLHHPTARQSATYLSRTDVLVKRISLRADPGTSLTNFPRPVHALFPDQQTCNNAIVQTLVKEIVTASDLVKRVDTVAKEYRNGLEAVKKVECCTQSANGLLAQLGTIVDRLENGVIVDDGDGTPPDLMSEACLEPMEHSAFLTLLPSILDEFDHANEETNILLSSYRAALVALDRPGIDPPFKDDAVVLVQRLASQQEHVIAVKQDVVTRVGRLRDVRKLRVTMEDALKELQVFRHDVGDALERSRWRQQTGRVTTPLTPESPSATLPSTLVTAETIMLSVDNLLARLGQEVESPLSSVSKTLEKPLEIWFWQSLKGLTNLADGVKQTAGLLRSIQSQAYSMEILQGEANTLQILAEDLKIRLDVYVEDVLGGRRSGEDLEKAEAPLQSDISQARTSFERFSSGLSSRVQLITPIHSSSSFVKEFVKRRFSSGNLELGVALQQLTTIELPFELATVDDAVRADSNAYAMRLSGDLHSIDQKVEYLHLAKIAKEVDLGLSRIVDDICQVDQELGSYKLLLTEVPEDNDRTQSLQLLSNRFDEYLSIGQSRIARSFSPVRDLLRQMGAASGTNVFGVQEPILVARTRSVDDTELKFSTWVERATLFKGQLAEFRRVEAIRIERERVEMENERARLEEERLRAEKERLDKEKLEKEERLEKERLEKERLEKERLEKERLEKERLEKERLEKERLEKERIEKERLEQERMKEEERERIGRERLENEKVEKERLKREQLEKERADKKRLEEEQLRKVKLQGEKDGRERSETIRQEKRSSNPVHQEDVFGLHITPSSPVKSRATNELQSRILSLRKRLRSINVNDVARPSSTSSSRLPTQGEHSMMAAAFSQISEEALQLPSSTEDVSVDVELRSLRSEIQASVAMIERVHKLAGLSQAVHACDNSLSDLLEHIDSYPATPTTTLSPHKSNISQPPEDQLSTRSTFVKSTIQAMISIFTAVADDPRAVTEHKRILQTWSELEEMSNDRINGKKSRPGSVISSGRNSSASVVSSHSIMNKKSSYSNLSVGPSKPGRFLVPAHPSTRRSISSSKNPDSRSSSRLSLSSRSVSGPMFSPSSSLYGSTFASRQRTSSLSSNSSATPTSARRIPETPSRRSVQLSRVSSPTFSDTSSLSRSVVGPSRSSNTASSWARAPRQSFSNLPRTTPPKHTAFRKKSYVANPKNKLDVAVGDVVNKLPVNINIEVVAETWQDQSGKYWIGDDEPRLCFCRILRSQTVMVRVGGGWTELSKFIRDHFADAFRLVPESPPRFGSREEKWISSATLLEAAEISETPPVPPRTPEPTGSFLPSFALSTPSGQSPRSIKSSPGSPLMPLQFMRRADPEIAGMRPVTPSKTSGHRSKGSVPSTPGRTAIWRP